MFFQVLQKYFVKFDSLEQLQLLNFQLLSSIKELSAEREREEFEKERKELEENGNASEDKKFVSKRVKELQVCYQISADPIVLFIYFF